MSFRRLSSAGAIVCVLAFVTTLFAQNRKHEDFASELRNLRHSYRDAMVKVVDVMHRRYVQGTDNVDGLLKAQFALADAEASIAANPAERMAAKASSLESLKKLEAYLEQRVKVGAGRSDELAKCTAARIFAEITLLEERERQSREK